MTDIIQVVRQFTEAVGCTTDRYNVRQTALYTGLQCEELSEKMDAMGLHSYAIILHNIGMEFKEGKIDESCIELADRAAMLDADVDLAWVTIGSALSQGADVAGACSEVARANMSKLVMCNDCCGDKTINRFDHETGLEYPISECDACNGLGLVAIKDDNGKVKKPDSFVPPNIEPFVCKEGGAA